MTIIRKIHNAIETKGGLECVLSDPSVDKYNDVIVQEGWKLDTFRKNPIALYGHDTRAPIGFWQNVRVERGALRGDLKLAPKGISARIDEIHGLVEARVLRSCSVGFSVIRSEPRDGGGRKYLEQELCEVSVVAIPANANALMQLGAPSASAASSEQSVAARKRLAEFIAAMKAEPAPLRAAEPVHRYPAFEPRMWRGKVY